MGCQNPYFYSRLFFFPLPTSTERTVDANTKSPMKQDFSFLSVSIFRGFSTPIGNIPLGDKLQEISSSTNEAKIGKIRALLREGKAEEAARVKKQLQGFTLSATYRERRVAEHIESYTDMLMLDFDDQPSAILQRSRKRIVKDPSTLFCFVSPSGNGLKVGIYMQDEPSLRLRSEFLSRPQVSYEELERYHKQMFDYGKEYYETLTGMKADDSGSDIGRLCFTSYDPETFINAKALSQVQLPSFSLLPPVPVVKHKSSRELLKAELPGRADVDCSHIDLGMQVEFQRCVRAVQREQTYVSGNRDNFVYAVGNKCYRRDLPEEVTALLADQQFGAPGLDIRRIIGNAYRYTSRTDQQEEEKKKSPARRIIDFVGAHYDIRRNVIRERLEYREKSAGETPFIPMKKKHYNSVYYDLQMADISCQLTTVKSLIDSRYARDYNPFEDYFYGLPPYDGKRDYIAELAATVTTTDQPFWADCLRRWLVGLVACALDDEVVNQLAIVMKGAQGKGKSSWIRHLLPPQLRDYYRNGMLNPENKDHMLFLSQCLLINLEEFEGMKNGNIAELKRIITQESVTERRAFDPDTDLYVRRASFIASTNEPRFHKDTSGNRRFPTITALEIDYRTPVNHEGIYSQALHLWRQGYHYWYENEEITELNRKNREYTLSGIEEELLYVYYRCPQPTDLSIKWLPAAAILSQLSINSRIQVNDRSVKNLIQVLERDGFRKRMNEPGIWEYEVVQFSFEEVEGNAKQRTEKKEEARDQELPF